MSDQRPIPADLILSSQDASNTLYMQSGHQVNREHYDEISSFGETESRQKGKIQDRGFPNNQFFFRDHSSEKNENRNPSFGPIKSSFFSGSDLTIPKGNIIFTHEISPFKGTRGNQEAITGLYLSPRFVNIGFKTLSVYIKVILTGLLWDDITLDVFSIDIDGNKSHHDSRHLYLNDSDKQNINDSLSGGRNPKIKIILYSTSPNIRIQNKANDYTIL